MSNEIIHAFIVVICRLSDDDDSYFQFEDMSEEQALATAEEELRQQYASDNDGAQCMQDFYPITCITSDTEMVVRHQT